MADLIAPNRKAIGAALSAGAAAALAAVSADGALSGGEWVVIVASAVGAFAVVWGVPNAQQAATDKTPVAVPQADASGTIVSTAVVTGPGATAIHYEPPSRLDVLDGVGEHRAPEPRDDV